MSAALSIAAIIVAIAFAVLVGYIAQTLKATQRTLNNVADTVESMEKQLEGITTETTLLLQKTNDLAEDVNYKVSKFDTVFDGIQDIGDSFNSLSKQAKRLTLNLSKTSDEDVEKATEAVKWSSAFFNAIKKRKK